VEEDVSFGFSTRKTDGSCRANIGSVSVSAGNSMSPDLQAILQTYGINPEALKNVPVTGPPSDDIQLSLMDLITAFHNALESNVLETPASGGRNG
jgi:hypothetical protein